MPAFLFILSLIVLIISRGLAVAWLAVFNSQIVERSFMRILLLTLHLNFLKFKLFEVKFKILLF